MGNGKKVKKIGERETGKRTRIYNFIEKIYFALQK